MRAAQGYLSKYDCAFQEKIISANGLTGMPDTIKEMTIILRNKVDKYQNIPMYINTKKYKTNYDQSFINPEKRIQSRF